MTEMFDAPPKTLTRVHLSSGWKDVADLNEAELEEARQLAQEILDKADTIYCSDRAEKHSVVRSLRAWLGKK
jgi:hypothetical protein